MSNALLFLLLFFLSSNAFAPWEARAKKLAPFPSVYHEMYEDHCDEHLEWGFVDQDGVPLQYDQGSGMGLGVHMWLGPRSGLSINKPDPVSPHRRPRLNDGESGAPIEVDPDPGPEPEPVGTWTFNVHNFSDTYSVWTNAEKNRMRSGMYILSQAVPTEEFEDLVKGFTDYRNGSGTALSQTPTQVYNQIWDASEPSWNVGVDHDADVKYMYRRTGCTYIGSAAVPGNYINICMTVYNNNGYNSVTAAANMLHEYSHTIGFGHQSASGTARANSVPYKMGDFVRSTASGEDWQAEGDALYPHNW